MEKVKESLSSWKERPWHKPVKKLDPDYFEVTMDYLENLYEKGPLPRKVKEFVWIAVDAACTHLYSPGLRQHITKALEYGATKEEIMQVLKMSTAIGLHSCSVGVPMLDEELERLEHQKKRHKKNTFAHVQRRQ